MKAKHVFGGLVALVGGGVALEAIMTGIAPAAVAAGVGVLSALAEGAIAVVGAGVGLVTGRALSGTTAEATAPEGTTPEEGGSEVETVLEDVAKAAEETL